MDVKKIYENRFEEKEMDAKNKIWQVLCGKFFNKFIKETDTVIDIGAGYCEFINNIKCKEKIAVDLNENIKKYAANDVKVINESCFSIASITDDSIDVVFMSNFLEHLQNKNEIIKVLQETRRILKDGGILMVLQPNIKYCKAKYWDFFDHHIPLTDKSLIEAIESIDYKITKLIPRFLPYSTKPKFPKSPVFVRLYLMFPFLWKIFGEQSFIIAQKYSNKGGK